MEIYNERMERIEDPDLSLGHLIPSTRTVHHDAVQGVKEVWHYETVKTYSNGGKDVRRVVDVPGVAAQEAWDEVIPICIYVPYTQEELDAIRAEESMPTQEERISALEAQLDMLLSGVTEDE